MKKGRIYFVECEHEGDLNNYLHDIFDCGGIYVSSELNYDAEIAEVSIEVDNIPEFLKKYNETEASDFGNACFF